MRLNVRFVEENEVMRFSSVCSKETFSASFSDTNTITVGNYNYLENRPTINSVVLEGALTAEDLGLGRVYYDTTENWDLHPDLIAEKGVVYIYSDHYTIEDDGGNRTDIAGLRIGDGTSYLIDIPFVSDYATSMIIMHVSNQDIHISATDRKFWNNKISSFLDKTRSETLILSKTQYENTDNGTIITVDVNE